MCFMFSGLAEAAGEYAFIARGTVVEIVSQGKVSDYKLKQADGSTVLLKSPGMEFEKGQDVAFFVRPGAKEGGLNTYLPLNISSMQPFPFTEFTEGRARLEIASDQVMMFDKQGRSVGKLYAQIEPFSEGLAGVKAKEHGFAWSFIDTEGNVVIEPNPDLFNAYDPDYRFRNGFVNVFIGYVDKKGNLAIRSKEGELWYPVTPFSEGRAFIQHASGMENGDIYMIDEKGVKQSQKPLATSTSAFPVCQPFSGGLAAFMKDNMWGFIGRSGAFVIEPEFDSVRPFSEGYAVVQTIDKKYGYIDAKGNWVVNASYDDAYPFSDGLALVRLGSHWGYVNANGELQIKATFEEAGYFSNGVAPAKAEAKKVKTERMFGPSTKWGLIDKNGNWVLEPKYDRVCLQEALNPPSFSDDLLLVEDSIDGARRFAWIDRSGKETLFIFMPRDSMW